ncbi:deoxyribodipyrimidine photo-lyase [Fundidesulfovibrio terrae]|uniref:deoxyribodipyrimidine photo-lyase n=1 Tax=Fundidesulfovibrio terrae TaxID=2922866 RepID=UPI001FB013C5
MNTRRARIISPGRPGVGPVVYWMHRDHRVRDNWALTYAALLAHQAGTTLVCAHCLAPSYPLAQPGHFRFLYDGLREIARDLAAQGIPHIQLLGDPPAEVSGLARSLDASAVVADFDPLRHKRSWMARAGEALACPLHEVDARNVVPCFVASDKQEYMARTIRPKIHRLLPEFLEDFPELPRQDGPSFPALPGRTWDEAEQAFPALLAPLPRFFAPGETAGRAALSRFVRVGLPGYAQSRNDPSIEGQSGLSPWLHFGMLSAQRAALAVASSDAAAQDKEAFLEELIVRRELSDNFCLHSRNYDSADCYPDWAKKTLDKHARDPRPYLYSPSELEEGRTHDPAWNAAQREMTLTGKMHGYMRMYWAKKLLEWTPCREEAQAVAVDLNDRLSLDGRDPNGYAGIAWAIGGVHDRPWSERTIFGQVRSMTFAGLKRKFDVEGYIRRVEAVFGM